MQFAWIIMELKNVLKKMSHHRPQPLQHAGSLILVAGLQLCRDEAVRALVARCASLLQYHCKLPSANSMRAVTVHNVLRIRQPPDIPLRRLQRIAPARWQAGPCFICGESWTSMIGSACGHSTDGSVASCFAGASLEL